MLAIFQRMLDRRGVPDPLDKSWIDSHSQSLQIDDGGRDLRPPGERRRDDESEGDHHRDAGQVELTRLGNYVSGEYPDRMDGGLPESCRPSSKSYIHQV